MRARARTLVLVLASIFSAEAWAATPVCQRTPQVTAAIAAAIKKPCEQILPSDLLTVRAIDISNQDVTSLRSDDFSGLARLEELRINENKGLKSIPPGLFWGL